MKKDRPIAKNASYMKIQNKQSVLKLIRNGNLSRAEIARRTGLTRAGVSIIIDALLKEGLVDEKGTVVGGVGRNPVILKLNPDAYHTIGIDITRENYSVGLVAFDGSVQESYSAKHDTSICPDKTLDSVLPYIKKMSEGKNMLGIGIATPGPIDSKKGIILNPPKLNSWHNCNVTEVLRRKSGINNVRLENNSMALALAEKHYGCCKDIADYLFVLVNQSGVGGGVVLNGMLYKGFGGEGAEIGHTSIKFDGPQCFCGNVGCLEMYTSIPTLMSRGQWFGNGECNQSLVEKEAVFIGTAIVNALNLFGLRTVVMAGGAIADNLCRSVKKVVSQRLMTVKCADIQIIQSTVTDGVLASANIIMDDFISNIRL